MCQLGGVKEASKQPTTKIDFVPVTDLDLGWG